MIPKLIDNTRALQLDLLERVSETHAAAGRSGVRAVSDGKKDQEDRDDEERGDSYEHQPPPEEQPTADFSRALMRANFADPTGSPEHPGQMIMHGMEVPPAKPSTAPADGRGGRLDLEA